MKRRAGWVALIVLLGMLCVSCEQTWRTRIEYGYGEPIAIGDHLNHRSHGEAIDASYYSVRVGPELYRDGPVGIDIMFGGLVVTPSQHESNTALGLSMNPRILLDADAVADGYENWQVFLESELGFGFANWEVQGSDFGFIVGIGPGVRKKLTEKWWFVSSLSLFHWSNAGTSQPNPGLNVDLFKLGLEYDF